MSLNRTFLALFSAATAISSAFLAFAIKAQPSDNPAWLAQWAIANRPNLSLGVLVLSLSAALAESWRWYVDKRHPAKETLAKVIDDFAKTMFRDQTKKNRITLFKATNGWRVFVFGTLKLLFMDKRHKWKALRRVRLRRTYLGVYVRPAAVRNHSSCTAFEVSDDPRDCEGVAGVVWEEGLCLIRELSPLDRDEVRSFKSWEDVPVGHRIREYAEATNISSLALLQSMDHFARHFMGTVIRRADGTNWGVLLLDSEERECPFPLDGGNFKVRFDDCARIIGKIVA
jgi:hypothetical protein